MTTPSTNDVVGTIMRIGAVDPVVFEDAVNQVLQKVSDADFDKIMEVLIAINALVDKYEHGKQALVVMHTAMLLAVPPLEQN